MEKLPMGVKVREEPLFSGMLIIIGIFGLLSVILRSIIWEYLLEMAMLPGLFEFRDSILHGSIWEGLKYLSTLIISTAMSTATVECFLITSPG